MNMNCSSYPLFLHTYKLLCRYRSGCNVVYPVCTVYTNVWILTTKRNCTGNDRSWMFHRITVLWIRVKSVLRIRIRDLGSGVFLTPGSGMGGKSASGSGIRYEQPGSYFLELRNNFFWFFGGLKYLNSFMRIQDPGWKKVESGIRDKHLWSATLV